MNPVPNYPTPRWLDWNSYCEQNRDRSGRKRQKLAGSPLVQSTRKKERKIVNLFVLSNTPEFPFVIHTHTIWIISPIPYHPPTCLSAFWLSYYTIT